jgi:hypothetical protein
MERASQLGEHEKAQVDQSNDEEDQASARRLVDEVNKLGEIAKRGEDDQRRPGGTPQEPEPDEEKRFNYQVNR